jgi:hypothetical protein
MPKPTTKRHFPCGKPKSGKLPEHLKHYHECADHACQNRKTAWDTILQRFQPQETNAD